MPSLPAFCCGCIHATESPKLILACSVGAMAASVSRGNRKRQGRTAMQPRDQGSMVAALLAQHLASMRFGLGCAFFAHTHAYLSAALPDMEFHAPRRCHRRSFSRPIRGPEGRARSIWIRSTSLASPTSSRAQPTQQQPGLVTSGHMQPGDCVTISSERPLVRVSRRSIEKATPTFRHEAWDQPQPNNASAGLAFDLMIGQAEQSESQASSKPMLGCTSPIRQRAQACTSQGL